MAFASCFSSPNTEMALIPETSSILHSCPACTRKFAKPLFSVCPGSFVSQNLQTFFYFDDVGSTAWHLSITNIEDIGLVLQNDNELRCFKLTCMTTLMLLSKQLIPPHGKNTIGHISPGYPLNVRLVQKNFVFKAH